MNYTMLDKSIKRVKIQQTCIKERVINEKVVEQVFSRKTKQIQNFFITL